MKENENIEKLKALDEITTVDPRHLTMGSITGFVPRLEDLHAHASSITLHKGVPEEIRNQFNVTRNMALYTYFHYSLAPVVQLKTYILIEHALKLRTGEDRTSFKKLLRIAVENGWVHDKGFRHLKFPTDKNEYCRKMIGVFPRLRNDAAHGSNLLMEDCVGHIEKCADYINQLFEIPADRDS